MAAGSNPIARPSREEEAAERAARVRAMLARWAAEDVGAEPAWDVDDIAPISLGESRHEDDEADP